MDNKNRGQYLQKLQIYGQKKNPEIREQQLRVRKKKYPYKQISSSRKQQRKELREGTIPVEIADLREEGKKISVRRGSSN